MLDKVDLSLKIKDKKEYETKLKELQLRLLGLQRALVDHKIGSVFVFEGWDAAGKGGAIKRVTETLDPRGFEVHPTAAPTGEEKSHHYLHRFWMNIPKYGKIGIFDRSWYGRVLVERVEKFAAKEEWERAYGEINHFEKILSQENFIVLKFWFHVSKEEQLKRFKDREKDPLKNWKITDEDWRNREKWNDYKLAVEDMINETDKKYAPWHIIEGEDKKYARIKTLKVIIKAIEKHCKAKDLDLKSYFSN
ncbi:polyphosphate kinase 2 family protein [Metabacillus sp. RGM 3146]|uniref:polyphosphate kinase 2 family protein n=1 Tax=Metabacillus sp. RGM 3146 TaxID=3401092 RepID=UPI003B9A1793